MSEYLYVVKVYSDHKGYDERLEGLAIFLDNDSVVEDIKEFILNNGFCITLQEALADIKNKRRVLGKKPWHHEVAQMNKGDLINFETYSPYCFSDFIVSRVQPNELHGRFEPNTGEYRDRIRAELFSGESETKKKLEKPDNMADSKTYKVMPLIEPPSGGGDIFIDGEPIEEVIKANSDSKRQPLTDSIITADRFVLIHPDTGEKTEVKPHFIIRNGVGIAQLDSYVDDKYVHQK